MAGSRPWSPNDRTGRPPDDILRSVQTRFPEATVNRMVGTFPAGDDNVFWVNRTGVEIQIDMRAGGAGPFIVESDTPSNRFTTYDPVVATEGIYRLLEPVAEG